MGNKPINLENGNIKYLIARIEKVEELASVRFDDQEKALILRTQEISRKLDALNGEAERLRLMQMTYLPREVWETNLSSMTSKIENLQSSRDNLLGQQTVFAGVVSAVIGLAFILVNHFLG